MATLTTPFPSAIAGTVGEVAVAAQVVYGEAFLKGGDTQQEALAVAACIANMFRTDTAPYGVALDDIAEYQDMGTYWFPVANPADGDHAGAYAATTANTNFRIAEAALCNASVWKNPYIAQRFMRYYTVGVVAPAWVSGYTFRGVVGTKVFYEAP